MTAKDGGAAVCKRWIDFGGGVLHEYTFDNELQAQWFTEGACCVANAKELADFYLYETQADLSAARGEEADVEVTVHQPYVPDKEPEPPAQNTPTAPGHHEKKLERKAEAVNWRNIQKSIEDDPASFIKLVENAVRLDDFCKAMGMRIAYIDAELILLRYEPKE